MSDRLEWGTVGSHRIAWSPLRSLVSADDGVDFTLEFREQYPEIMVDDRPLAMADIQPEGRP